MTRKAIDWRYFKSNELPKNEDTKLKKRRTSSEKIYNNIYY